MLEGQALSRTVVILTGVIVKQSPMDEMVKRSHLPFVRNMDSHYNMAGIVTALVVVEYAIYVDCSSTKQPT